MPFNEKDKTWLRNEIGQQIGEAVAPQIAAAIEALRPRGFQRFTRFLREWSLTGAAFTVFVGMLGIIVALSYNLTSGAKTTEHRLTQIEDRLTQIDAKILRQTATQAPAAALKELATLDPKRLAVNLPALRTVSEVATSQMPTAPSELQSVAFNLARVDPATKDYWQTVLQFIQFASAHFATDAPPPGSPVNFMYKNNSGISVRFPRHSVIVIDGSIIENQTIEDSRIIFTGAPTVLRNVKFVNCAFEFRNIDQPSPFLEAAGRELLATGIQKAFIVSLG